MQTPTIEPSWVSTMKDSKEFTDLDLVYSLNIQLDGVRGSLLNLADQLLETNKDQSYLADLLAREIKDSLSFLQEWSKQKEKESNRTACVAVT